MSVFITRRILALSSSFQVRSQLWKQCQCASYSNTTPQVVKRGPTPLEQVNEEPLPVTTPTGESKVYEPKIVKLVDEISQLTLLQVADLNELLKKTLNIPDAPMMGAMAFAAPAAPAEEEEAAAPQKVQTSFTLKLMKFDEAKKVALIKECKSLLEGMNLVQAKKFVESAPCVVKADIPKDEAEKLQKALEAAGGTCEVS
ncbi:39S ribosomal protein L12, mitochondrial [Orchesella cincta]|uniref:39S ribosomal protein L12, mitochondrial n=1 Tax=Orchesella cincta TaxID=48709 RepID=A0A1D2M8J1_ORCCI|nr:39S ribosomal protein L12, mitochondrial [Orchesella cincta]